MPLVFDVQEGKLHWLDVYAKGGLAFNNVATSNRDITEVCPNLIAYFASGVRTSIYDLALLHAAWRCRSVILRGEQTRRFVREETEDAASFLARLREGQGELADLPAADGPPLLAALHRGDVALPANSECYALFREGLTSTISASDLIS